MTYVESARHALASSRARTAGIVWIAAGVIYLALEAIAALAFPGYSYAGNYISDLGMTQVAPFEGRAIDSPLHNVMMAAFVIQGVLFIIAAMLFVQIASGRTRRLFTVLAWVNGIGIILVGFFPADTAAYIGDLDLVFMHGVGAAMAIVGGNLALIASSGLLTRLGAPRWMPRASIAIGIIGIVCLLMLPIGRAMSGDFLVGDGVWERASVYSFIVWELMVGAFLIAANRRARRAPITA